ncbi:hypothetical protein DOTSEDRAFT_36529 [Dothistroma septosporum NZE10]|uniref:Uncharacterized protein n=1 Tax=Dothistroma septosporum (strain NZE10 / CBS 128990) TaxID=675120 RepID=N1PMI8_DOTSN|nr:hypothetical protein DOTSEDRAFT_36529 [Dothistroma septosporum NZE10]
MSDKESKRLLADSSALDTRPAKRHSLSDSSVASTSPYATSYTSAAPRSTDMRRLERDFTYFTDLDDSDNEQSDSLPQDVDLHLRSSPLAARNGEYSYLLPPSYQTYSHETPAYHASYLGADDQDTAETHLDSVGDDQDLPADDLQPGGVAVALAAATAAISPERSASPPSERSVAGETRPSRNNPRSRHWPLSSADHDEYEQINLRDIDQLAREELYRHLFGGTTIPLENFDISDACREYPELAVEIISAYIQHTTFSVKVWANYDSFTKKLYRQPSRLATCGRLQLHDRRREYLDNTVTGLQFSKLQLLIGNPFRTLATVSLEAVDRKLEVGGNMLDDVHGPHGMLKWVVEEALDNIKQDGILRGYWGLTLQDLDLIAKEFVYLPKSQQDLWQYFAN